MNSTASSYAIRVAGHLDSHWASWLGEVALAHEDDSTTTIIAAVARARGASRRILERPASISPTLPGPAPGGPSEPDRGESVTRPPSSA
jgi:hypothetical protein